MYAIKSNTATGTVGPHESLPYGQSRNSIFNFALYWILCHSFMPNIILPFGERSMYVILKQNRFYIRELGPF